MEYGEMLARREFLEAQIEIASDHKAFAFEAKCRAELRTLEAKMEAEEA